MLIQKRAQRVLADLWSVADDNEQRAIEHDGKVDKKQRVTATATVGASCTC